MNIVDEIKVDQCVFFDIESASQVPKLDPKSEMFKVFQYKHRDKETGELLNIKDTQELFNKTAALSPIYCKIIAFGALYIKDNEFHYKIITGEEKDILIEAFKILNTNGKLCLGYNTSGYDIPVMRVRALAHGIKIPEKLNDMGVKPWTLDSWLPDEMKLFQGTHYARFSLDEVCLCLGVPSPKNTGVKGSEVSAEYWKNGTKNIENYLIEDLKSTANVFLRMQGKPIIE